MLCSSELVQLAYWSSQSNINCWVCCHFQYWWWNCIRAAVCRPCRSWDTAQLNSELSGCLVQPADKINLGPEYERSHFYFQLHCFCQKWSFPNIKSHVTNINLSTCWDVANIKSYQIREADVTPIKNFGMMWLGDFFQFRTFSFKRDFSISCWLCVWRTHVPKRAWLLVQEVTSLVWDFPLLHLILGCTVTIPKWHQLIALKQRHCPILRKAKTKPISR